MMGYEVGMDWLSVCLITWADTQHYKTISHGLFLCLIADKDILHFKIQYFGSGVSVSVTLSDVRNNSQSALNNFNLKRSL